MKGVQAVQPVVDSFQLRLQQLVQQAEAAGVVLRIDVVPLLPLAMGNHAMCPIAYAAWSNA